MMNPANTVNKTGLHPSGVAYVPPYSLYLCPYIVVFLPSVLAGRTFLKVFVANICFFTGLTLLTTLSLVRYDRYPPILIAQNYVPEGSEDV